MSRDEANDQADEKLCIELRCCVFCIAHCHPMGFNKMRCGVCYLASCFITVVWRPCAKLSQPFVIGSLPP